MNETFDKTPPEDPPKPKNKGGRPREPTTFVGHDHKKQRIFAKFLNKHAMKTLPQLEDELNRSKTPLTVIEMMAIRTLIRGAVKGDVTTIELVLNTAPDKTRTAQKKNDKRRAAAEKDGNTGTDEEALAFVEPEEFE